MVSLSLPDDERGQLLLVGAAVIALVIVGSVILLNGLKFTDTVGTEGNFDATDEAQRTAEMVRGDLSKMADRVRNDTGLVNFETAIRQNISIYSNRLSNMTFADSATYVNVSLNKKRSEMDGSGVLVKETNPATRFTHPFGASDFNDPYPVAENASVVSPANLTIKDFSCSGTSAGVRVTVVDHKTGTDYWSMQITCQTTSDTELIQVRESPSGPPILRLEGGSDFTTTNNVDIDIRSGTVNGNQWDELKFESAVDGPYDISAKYDGPRGQALEGSYMFGSDSEYSAVNNPDKERISVYRPAFTFVYERPGITYNTTLIEEGGA